MYCDEMIMKQVAKSKGKNKAGKYEGEYYVSIKGNSIHVDDLKTWDYGESKCDPQDKFDVGEGVKVAMDRLIERREGIKVGDKVTMVSGYDIYGRYSEWVAKNMDKESMCRFAYGIMTINPDRVFTVIKIAKHQVSDNLLAYVRDDEKVGYVTNLTNLKKVD